MRGYYKKYKECKKKCIQVIYLQEQCIRSHKDPYVTYMIDSSCLH
jgi:hypothetical protein